MLSASDSAVSLLLVTAASLASFHTLIGVDHSVPFIILGRARGWSLRRTLGITGACGLVHVASSALIGSAGLLLGIALNQLAWLESTRGNVAAGLMIGFGLSYTARAVWYRFRRASHTCARKHADGTAETYSSDHHDVNLRTDENSRDMTPWALFLVFAFGPCELLIPLMVVPATERSWLLLGTVVGVFGIFTVGAMLVAVTLGYLGLSCVQLGAFERQIDVLAGLAIAASGTAMFLFGV